MKGETLVETPPLPEQHAVESAYLERDPRRPFAQQVFLVRHAEAGWSLSGQDTGLAGIPLATHVRHTAKRLGLMLARERFALVLTSPPGRARATATCTLSGLGDLAETDRDLREWDSDESPEAVGTRVDRVIDRIRAARGHVALFAHGHVFQVLAARWLGLPAFAGHHFLLDTATLNILSHYNGIPAIKRWNAPLGPPAEEALEDA